MPSQLQFASVSCCAPACIGINEAETPKTGVNRISCCAALSAVQAPIIIRDLLPSAWRTSIEIPSDNARVAIQIASMAGA